jgi:hypothetical protein
MTEGFFVVHSSFDSLHECLESLIGRKRLLLLDPMSGTLQKD